MSGWQDFQGLNSGYVVELYERYRRDPNSVDPETRAAFERWQPPIEEAEAAPRGAPTRGADVPLASAQTIVGAVNLAMSIRRYGHLAPQLDPPGTPPVGDPALDPATPKISDDELRRLPAGLVRGQLTSEEQSALEVVS